MGCDKHTGSCTLKLRESAFRILVSPPVLRELVQTSVYSCGFSTPKNLPCTIFFCIGSCGYRAFRLFNRTFGATYCTRQYDYIFHWIWFARALHHYIYPFGSIMCLSILCAGVSPSIIPDSRLAWQLITSKQYRKKQLWTG